MTKHKDNYCVILAGGVGKRLWPTSRRRKPKQFLDFFGIGRTLLQQTFDRMLQVVALENIFIATYEGYRDIVLEQLPELSESQVLTEPVQLSTAPATVWAVCQIRAICADANIIVTPCDQLILREDRFAEEVTFAFDYVRRHDVFLAMGVKAEQPNTAYGYIQMGDEVERELFEVRSFLEKPDEEYADKFIESGEFLWNTGLFVWNAQTFCKLVSKQLPDLAERLFDFELCRSPHELEHLQRLYPEDFHRSIDLVILEKIANVLVMRCDFGWSDVGCWPEMYKVATKDGNDNALIGEGKVILSDTHHSIISTPQGQAAVVKGLDNFVVAQKGNVLVICPNDDPSLAKQLFKEAEIYLGEDYT